MWKLWAITALFTLSCGMTEAPTEPSRLRRNVLHASDGTTLDTLSFFDTKRQEDCGFQQVRDRLYCLPQLLYISPGYFGDEACSIPAVYTSKCGSQPSLARTLDGCDTPPKFYTLKPADHIYTMNGMGKCQPNPSFDGFAVYAADAEVPLSTFVSASMATH